jgi:tRNA G18 (ribose-2'-O)-methylase SpoU
MKREETRLERYFRKANNAVELPTSFVTIHFHCDENLASIIRTAACFGVRDIHVIGSIPDRNILYNPSGSLVDFVNLHQYSRPSEFLAYSRENDLALISAEISDDSTSLYEYQFDFNRKSAIVLGNESAGIPVEILFNSDVVHIPMLGSGYCLNTSQTGNSFITEYSRQYVRNRDG